MPTAYLFRPERVAALKGGRWAIEIEMHPFYEDEISIACLSELWSLLGGSDVGVTSLYQSLLMQDTAYGSFVFVVDSDNKYPRYLIVVDDVDDDERCAVDVTAAPRLVLQRLCQVLPVADIQDCCDEMVILDMEDEPPDGLIFMFDPDRFDLVTA